VLEKTILISHEEKEEIKFVIEQSKKNVDAWKSHLRSVNQDEGRIDMLNTFDSKPVLVVLDWAMKFIPRKYRESQNRLVWQARHILARQRGDEKVRRRQTNADANPCPSFPKEQPRQLFCFGSD
jgi:hypothetical protein